MNKSTNLLVYKIGNPLSFLSNTPTKAVYKKLVKTAIKVHWFNKFKSQICSLKSLRYFKFEFLGFHVHPIFSTCSASPYETEKATVQARLLSGRYYLERVTRFWTDNEEGLCSLPLCQSPENRHLGDIESFLSSCPSLQSVRDDYSSFLKSFLNCHPHLTELVNHCITNCPEQFYLDCSTIPEVIIAKNSLGTIILSQLFKLTRHYCFILHKERQNLLKI